MPGFAGTMHEWGQGQLHSGSKKGPVVNDQKQALAIAFSQARKAGESVPPKSTTREVGKRLLSRKAG